MRDLGQGPLAPTGNPLDVALDGPGYLAVETVQGTRYTRSGRLQLDGERRIVDANGLPVLGEGDRPIQVPQDAGPVRIAGDGTISTEAGAALGRLKVVGFERPQAMTELGGGLYATDEAEQASEATRVVQGSIEQSNVQPIVEMTQMTEVLRQYQTTQKLIESEHERQRTAIQRLARAN
jgi:flagellar basal-body rod protein FlgF